ncbi:MAG: hypothetical protein CVU03_09730 [Bacteroidetes bacterium HGW-Bacteroidetes-2]|jgi:peptidoglycan/LPS O-acetylase OafA/YrhL|nr:MAG: hypothetical protein CVU03_09730 [Bacteroidetes bacterium HGW-Bacteroidetes-2]
MNINYKERIFGLDFMRAVAILFVVFSHALWIFPDASGSFVDVLHLVGVMGVEIFFVLSGFLIGRILFRIFTKPDFKHQDIHYFLIRRWFRTIPNYYLALLINIGIVLYFGRELPDSIASYFFFLQNAVGGMDIFFTESWSLPIEEFAYILCPFLLYATLLFNLKIAKQKLFLFVTLTILLLFLCTKTIYNFITPSSDMNDWNINLKAVVLYRIDAIYYGVLAAYLSLTFKSFWLQHKNLFLFIGITAFLTMHFWISSQSIIIKEYPFFWNVLYLPVCSICIALSLPFLSQWKVTSTLGLRFITNLSLISYAMYLLHYSIILQLMRYFYPIESLQFSEKLFFTFVYIFLTVILSYVFYHIYEKPMMNIRDKAYFRKKYTKL